MVCEKHIGFGVWVGDTIPIGVQFLALLHMVAAHPRKPLVIRVTQLRHISQVCHKMARDAGLVALAAAQVPSYLSLMITASILRVCGQAAWVFLCLAPTRAVMRALQSSTGPPH